MNDFTKEKLQDIYTSLCEDCSTRAVNEELLSKIQYMIVNWKPKKLRRKLTFAEVILKENDLL